MDSYHTDQVLEGVRARLLQIIQKMGFQGEPAHGVQIPLRHHMLAPLAQIRPIHPYLQGAAPGFGHPVVPQLPHPMMGFPLGYQPMYQIQMVPMMVPLQDAVQYQQMLNPYALPYGGYPSPSFAQVPPVLVPQVAQQPLNHHQMEDTDTASPGSMDTDEGVGKQVIKAEPINID